MSDQHEPPERESPPWARPVLDGIPVARPVTVPYAPPEVRGAHEILLLQTRPQSAWADLGAAIVIVLAFVLYAEGALAAITGVFDLPLDVPDSEVNRVILVPALTLRAAGIITITALILRNRRQSMRSVGITRKGLALNLVLGVGAMAVSYGLIIFWVISSWVLWPDLTEQLTDNAERIMDLVPKQSPVGFALLALLIGVYEELFFRGFLMTRLRRATGSWTAAVLLSTALFAALHTLDQELAALVPITILSIVFSLVTIWRYSIVPAIVGHWLFNLSQFLGLYFTAGESWT